MFFCVSKKTRVHILTRRSKYEQGGSWNNNAKNCVVGKRNNDNPDNSNDNLGFRVAMSKNWRPCQFLDASFGRLRLPKRRYCVEPPPSVAVLRAHTNGVNSPWWKMYIRVHFSSTRFAIYSATDGGGTKQKRCFSKVLLLKNSHVTLQHGCCNVMVSRFCMEPAASVPLLKNQFCRAQNQTGQYYLFRTPMDGRGFKQKRVCENKLAVNKCTRRYIC